MPEYENIIYEKQRGGVLITLNRPETLNALSQGLRVDLRAALEDAETDPEIRAVVITGAGRAFSSGAAIGGAGREPVETVWPYGLPKDKSIAQAIDEWRTSGQAGLQEQLYRWEYPKPIISAINGWCLGAGSWLALSCHLSIAADDAVFGQPEVRMVSNTNFIWTLLAGCKNSLRYSLTGDHIDAEEALRIGLINKIVPKDQLLDESFELVERIAKVSPETVKTNLMVTTLGIEAMGFANALVLNNELSAVAHVSKREEFNRHLDAAQSSGGLRSFLQTRDAPFQPEPFGPRSRRAM